MTVPEESFEKALISNAAAIGCMLEFMTDLYIGFVESFAYTVKDNLRRKTLLLGPRSNRITFSLISSPA